jgi:energy-coupling factor transport system ATP-binding protein
MGINFQRVNFKYSYKAPLTLKEVNLEISEKNEFICILGHTGSGKSTLVQNMNALLLPTSGQITVFNKNVIKVIKHPYKLNTKKNRLKYNFIDNKKLFARGNKVIYSSHLKDLRKHIGLVFQFPEYQLFESTVLKDVMFGPKNYGLSDEEARHEAKKACTIVGLPKDVLEKSPFSLSGGQMRRVAIAGIIALNPDVIVLDEPTVGLDPKGKEELMNLLVSIQKETSKTIIMITHDMNVVGKYAKRVIVMDKGVKVFDGNKRDLFENIERLHNFNLDLPTSANLAVKLKEKGLINYTHLPLSKEELETVILGGDINE